MAESQDVQKEQADARGRDNLWNFEVGDKVLLNAKNLPTHAVSAVCKTKLRPRLIGPFTVVAKGLCADVDCSFERLTYDGAKQSADWSRAMSSELVLA
ncbi:Pol Polyprotein [Phytophthora megakarya]|uniref:Pol Polyprotein n=1 Tax=Phytophthora megakarya TaxID=4795 RepID=A0A225UI78_9STRA|nr:Pol Polyprotein [Phytophthora megakarya]